MYSLIRNRLLFRDPGLLRLSFALRTILALFAAGMSCYALSLWGDFGTSGIILGILAAQLTSLLARQPARRDRIITCLVMIPGNWTGLLLLHFLVGYPYLDVIILPVLISAGFLAQAFNMRLGAALLAAAWIFMFSVYLAAAGSELGWHLVAVTVGILVSMLLRFLVWRDDRTLNVKLLVLSHRLVLIDFAETASRHGISSGMTRLLTRMQPVANAIVASTQVDEPLRDALADLRLSLEVAVMQDHSAGSRFATALRNGDRDSGSAEVDHARKTVDARLSEVNVALRDSARLESRPVPPSESRAGGLAKGGSNGQSARRALMKRSVQVFVATSLATATGYWISDLYWPWAVIVAMFLYLGTESAGHVLDKGVNSAIGVLSGVLAGFAMTYMLATLPQAEIMLVPLLLFLALYLMPVNYAMGVALITIIMGLVYQLLGLPASSVLILRLGEVLSGAAAGAFAALVIFPHRSVALVRERAAQLLDGLADAIDPEATQIRHAELRQRFAGIVAAVDIGHLSGLMIERSRLRSSLADLSHLLHLVEVFRHLQRDADVRTNKEDLLAQVELARHLRELAGLVGTLRNARVSKADAKVTDDADTRQPMHILHTASMNGTGTAPERAGGSAHQEHKSELQSSPEVERDLINRRLLQSMRVIVATLSQRNSGNAP